MADLQLHQLRKVYPGGINAVESLSLTVPDGECLVLVGPSGCGKSTTLRMIAGLEEPTSGEVHLGARNVTRLPPRDRDVAMVFQNYALYPHMSAEENMAFGLRMRGVPRAAIRARVRQAAELLGIVPLLQRTPNQLSGGERQRLALGRAIVREPACFLFDEPLSNLDARRRAGMRAELKRLLQRLRVTTVYVTHDQEEAMTLGDRIAVMADGRLQQCGAPMEVYARPANQFVAGFIGMPPMNFMAGLIEFPTDAPPRFRSREGGLVPLNNLPDAARNLLRAGDVTLGIRPEHLQPIAADDSRSEGPRFHGTIVMVETLGAMIDVTLEMETGDVLVARLAAAWMPKTGEPMILRCPVESLHFFEPGRFGRCLLAATGAEVVGMTRGPA